MDSLYRLIEAADRFRIRTASTPLIDLLTHPEDDLCSHVMGALRSLEPLDQIPRIARGARQLEENLVNKTAAPGFGGWESIRPLSVRPNAAGTQATALCRVTLGSHNGTFRFWLARAGRGWKTYDFESSFKFLARSSCAKG